MTRGWRFQDLGLGIDFCTATVLSVFSKITKLPKIRALKTFQHLTPPFITMNLKTRRSHIIRSCFVDNVNRKYPHLVISRSKKKLHHFFIYYVSSPLLNTLLETISCWSHQLDIYIHLWRFINHFHIHSDSMYPTELEIKDTTKFSKSVSDLDILWNMC